MMDDEYVQTVVLDQRKVRQEIADVERRVTVQALEIETTKEALAILDRTEGYIVKHQVKSSKALEAMAKMTEASFAQLQIMNARANDVEILQAAAAGQIDDMLGAARSLRPWILCAIIVSGVEFVALLALWAVMVWRLL
jgi:hypothetical protein